MLFSAALNPQALLGGRMQMHADKAQAAIDALATRLGVDRTRAAAGVLEIINVNMMGAVRVISVEQGEDPRDFTLVAFGGAGLCMRPMSRATWVCAKCWCRRGRGCSPRSDCCMPKCAPTSASRALVRLTQQGFAVAQCRVEVAARSAARNGSKSEREAQRHVPVVRRSALLRAELRACACRSPAIAWTKRRSRNSRRRSIAATRISTATTCASSRSRS